MDLTDTQSTLVFVCALAILVGTVGVVVPVVPGLILSWGAVLVWALFSDAGWGRWLVLFIATFVALAGTAAKYAWPGRRLKQSGVPNWSLIAGGLLGIVGFFVVPVVGLPLGFVLGILLAELARLKQMRAAWAATWHAVKAVGLSMLIELSAALGVAVVWVVGVIAA
ncbi:DUF456 domain-containing protein [Hamadaea sp. NPDC050747]|uniref:DUF456 domain-containing protein n=1 Tax=Hamadaea sp. NPDC050747 TaxID=3155789 RepID=UPI0033EAABCF